MNIIGVILLGLLLLLLPGVDRGLSGSESCASGLRVAASEEECRQQCDPGYMRCQDGCRSITDPAKASDCVRGCFRGFEGCKARCMRS
jgi:hypothetical protein